MPRAPYIQSRKGGHQFAMGAACSRGLSELPQQQACLLNEEAESGWHGLHACSPAEGPTSRVYLARCRILLCIENEFLIDSRSHPLNRCLYKLLSSCLSACPTSIWSASSKTLTLQLLFATCRVMVLAARDSSLVSTLGSCFTIAPSLHGNAELNADHTNWTYVPHTASQYEVSKEPLRHLRPSVAEGRMASKVQ